ncbi:hypothetical protein MNBD_ALPHA03-1813 [hydrothermal vent metagenome]|uniref:Uncharacterized protein n=1 Tax=hydrothermal vent metagenome TaxID=652676 RepID=A0A3B1AJQ4_9ZZZZ
MNITSNSQLLASLNGLIDPNQRQQQQALQDRQLKQENDKQAAEQSSKAVQDSGRQNRIEANREALKKLQDRLKADNIEKLKSEFSVGNVSVDNSGGQNQGVNLNLRESLGNSNKPVDTRPGQIIDIRV